MPGSVTLNGKDAVIRWGYYPAVTVTNWQATLVGEDRWQVTGTVASSDVSRVSQRPLTFVVRHAKGFWRWPVDALQVVDGTLTASLGPQER